MSTASAGNWTRVWTVAGYYSTTRPLMPCMENSTDSLILIVTSTVSVLDNAQILSVFPWNSDYFQKWNISYQRWAGTRRCTKPCKLSSWFSKCITAVLKQSMKQFRYVTMVLQIIFWKSQIDIHWFIHVMLWFWNNWNPLVLRFILF